METQKPSILTFMKMLPIKAHQLTPNYFVLPGNIYLFFLLSILILSLVSLWATQLNSRSSLSFWAYTKEMFTHLSNIFLAHTRAMGNRSPRRTIRLVLLISVTLILALYNACFSMDNLRIVFPKYYKTYESILKEPPKNIRLLPPLPTHFNRSRSKKTAENEIVKLHASVGAKKLLEIGKRGENLVVFASSPEDVCFMLKGVLKSTSGTEWRAAESVDPEASEFSSQFHISSSILNKTQGWRVLEKLRRLAEMDMPKGILHQYTVAQLHLAMRRGKSATFAAHSRRNKPCFDKMQSDLHNYRDVSAQATRPLFAAWIYFIILAPILFAGECVTHRLHQINLHKKNRVTPLTIHKMQPRSVQLTQLAHSEDKIDELAVVVSC